MLLTQWDQIVLPIVDTPYACIRSCQSGELFVGGAKGSIALSLDSGATWKCVRNPSANNEIIYSLVATKSGTWIAITDSGVFNSGDKGFKWQNVTPKYIASLSPVDTTWATLRCTDLVDLCEISSGTLLLSNGSNAGCGLWRSTDQGSSWQFETGEKPFNTFGTWVFSVAASDTVAYISTWENLYRSVDDGRTWTEILCTGGLQIHSIFIGANGLLLATPERSEFGYVYRSTDSGANWDDGPRKSGWALTHLKELESGIIFGLVGGRIMFSNDFGITWHDALQLDHYPNGFINDFAIHDDGRMYLLVGGKVLRTNSSCYSLPDLPAPKLVSPEDKSTDVSIRPQFIWEKVNNATCYNVEFSLDSLFLNWSAWGYSVIVDDTLWQPSEYEPGFPFDFSTFFWRVIANNFWQYTVSSTYRFQTGKVTIVSETINSPTGYHLSQNFPNPFNPSTSFSFTLPKSGFIKIQIFDILGNIITTLVDGICTKGQHSVVWNAQHFTGGIYFCTMKSEGFIATKKFVFIK